MELAFVMTTIYGMLTLTFFIIFFTPIFIWYFFYNKYLNKFSVKDKPSIWRMFLDIIISNLVAWFTYILLFTSIVLLVVIYDFTKLQYFWVIISIILAIISYYLVLKLLLSRYKSFKKEIANKIASNITGSTFWVLLLLMIILAIIWK